MIVLMLAIFIAGSGLYILMRSEAIENSALNERIEAGNVFGAGALVMEGHRRLGTAQAETDCRLIEMNREKFLFAVQESPMFAIELLASVDARLRDLKIKAHA